MTTSLTSGPGEVRVTRRCHPAWAPWLRVPRTSLLALPQPSFGHKLFRRGCEQGRKQRVLARAWSEGPSRSSPDPPTVQLRLHYQLNGGSPHPQVIRDLVGEKGSRHADTASGCGEGRWEPTGRAAGPSRPRFKPIAQESVLRTSGSCVLGSETTRPCLTAGNLRPGDPPGVRFGPEQRLGATEALGTNA